MEGARIRRLEEQDIDAAIALTDLEQWGYTRADFRRLRAFSPDGCFVAESDRRVVGVLTTTAYDGLAFLGAVIVMRTVRLNAYLDAIPFYEKLGFRREYEVIRWHGDAVTGRMQGVRPVRFDDLEPLSRFDERYFGANRRVLLERLADEFPSTFLVSEHRGLLRGFIVGNASGDSCEVGPWVVRPGSGLAATDLFGALVVRAGRFGGLPGASDGLGSRRIRRRPGRDLGPRRLGERLKSPAVFRGPMTERRLLALVALLIGVIGGLLILIDALPGFRQISDLGQALSGLVGLILGLAILAASLLIYRSQYSSGGILDLLLGIVVLVLRLNFTGAILAIVAGVIGLIAAGAGTRRP